MSPSLVLSLDFELRWGVHDSKGSTYDDYRSNLEGAREVVPQLLQLFVERDVRATWATVGALACEDWGDYLARAPHSPRYTDRKLAFDPGWIDRDPEGNQHFAPRLVELVARTPGQEIGSHTFGHIFFREPGVMRRDVEADTAAARKVLQLRTGYAPQSLVFPRNQVLFADVLRDGGITVARTEAAGWCWSRTEAVTQSALVRGLRLLSTFSPPQATPTVRDGVRALPASAFVRFNLPDPAFDAACRALAARARALRGDDTLHVWFHPHNLGDAPARKVALLGRLLERVGNAAPTNTRWRTFSEFAVQGAKPTAHQ